MSAPLSHHVLVVEDDHAIGSQLVKGLKSQGFTVEWATDGEGVVERVLSCGAHAMVLDINLPGRSGFEILTDLRGRTSIPVVVLTARVELDARLRAFEGGAADFLPKPFFLEELVARLRARLGAVGQVRRVVQWAGVEVDLDAREVRVRGADAGLTPHELNVLAWLVERPKKAVSRRQLADGALSADGEVSERTVDSHVVRIRRKLGEEAAAALRTVWGVGYAFHPPEAA
jgi:two-component system OmpR family response regulator